MISEFRAIAGAAGDENIAVSNTVQSLTVPADLKKTGRAVVQVRTAGVVYTLNGVAPTAADASTGQTLAVGDLLIVTGSEMSVLQLIRSTGTDSAVHVRYERRIN